MSTTELSSRGRVISTPVVSSGGRCSHTVQFYEDDNVLLDSLVRFVGSALRAGDAALVVATPEHQECLLDGLERSGLDVLRAAEIGRFVCLDASDALSGFLVDGSPDAERFHSIVGSALQQLQKSAENAPPGIAAFGEMVRLLWAQGNGEAAIRLEQLWNQAIQAYPCRLLCAYPMAGFSDATQAEALQNICAEHTHIIPGESYSSLDSEEERLRTVVLLQQKAQALGQKMEEREQLNAAMMQAEKTAAAGRLAATVAHEINNPLEAVVNLLYILRSSIGDNREAQKYLALADSELARAAQITKQTLSFYRERQSPAMVEIRELFNSVLHVFSKRLSEKQVTVVRHEEPCFVVGMKGELRQLFSNLMDNAIAAVGDQGRIEISVTQDGDAVIVSIADNGHGIPAERQARLFEAFYTTKQDSGTGLGLWVAREIAEKHQGQITAQSSTDPLRHGTTFRVRLAGLPRENGKPAKTLRPAA